MDSACHVLVVDDHADIRDPLARYLERNGVRASKAADAAAARKMLQTAAIDVVVLDVMMPGEDGLSLCRHLREAHGLPVILLTALGEETDRVVGLEVGADDYVVKPFSPRELLARIKAVLRRTNALPPQREPAAGEGTTRFGDWTLDRGRQELIDADGVAVPLSTGEFRLLAVLLDHAGRVLSREQLLDLTQGRGAEPFDRAIDNQVMRLRRKIEPDAAHPHYIRTVRGAGYMLAGPVEDRS